MEGGGSSAPGEEAGWPWAPGGGLWVPWHREKGGRDEIILMRKHTISEGAVFQAILRTLRRLSKLRILTLAKTDSNIGIVILKGATVETILRLLRTPTKAKKKNRDRKSRFTVCHMNMEVLIRR